MIKQFVPKSFCLTCRECCRFAEEDSVWLPYLLDGEIEKLKKENIPPSFISPEKRIKPAFSPKEDVFACPFLNSSDNKCSIYKTRPFECQLYPFLIRLGGPAGAERRRVNRNQKNNIFLAVSMLCPYVKERVGTPEFNEYVLYLVNLLNSRFYRLMLEKDPKIAHTYKEVLDVTGLS